MFLIRRKKVNTMGTDVTSVKSGSRKLQERPSNGFCFPHEVIRKATPTVRWVYHILLTDCKEASDMSNHTH